MTPAEKVERLRDGLLAIMGRQAGGCEHTVDTNNNRRVASSCLTDGRTHDARYGADRTCDACLAADTLGMVERDQRRLAIAHHALGRFERLAGSLGPPMLFGGTVWDETLEEVERQIAEDERRGE